MLTLILHHLEGGGVGGGGEYLGGRQRVGESKQSSERAGGSAGDLSARHN